MRRFIGYMYRYIAPPAQAAVKEYQAVADLISLPLAPLALAYVYSRPFVTSTIIGATNVQQLRDNVLALNLAPLSDDVLDLLNGVYKKHRDPSKALIISNQRSIVFCNYFTRRECLRWWIRIWSILTRPSYHGEQKIKMWTQS